MTKKLVEQIGKAVVDASSPFRTECLPYHTTLILQYLFVPASCRTKLDLVEICPLPMLSTVRIPHLPHGITISQARRFR